MDPGTWVIHGETQPIDSPVEDHKAYVGSGMTSHKETAINLKDCIDHPVRVKLAGGREGEQLSKEGWILLRFASDGCALERFR